MRYMIAAETIDLFRQARQIAAADTRIYVESEELLLLSTGELSDTAYSQIVELGVEVVEDFQYQPDAGSNRAA